MPERIEIKVGQEKIIGVLHQVDDTDLDTGAIASINLSAGACACKCVISCHGLLASKDSIKYIMLAEELNKLGISSLRFDFRGCGESDGRLTDSHISNRSEDLNAVVEHAINELGFSDLGLFGSSMGGYLSFLEASHDTQVKALVSLSSPYSMVELFNARGIERSRYEIDGVVFDGKFISDVRTHGVLGDEILNNIKCPVLIIHGDIDWLVPANHARRLFAAINTEKKLVIVRGGDHIFSFPNHLTQVIKMSLDWFGKYL